jgi:hypothetical protein
MKERERGREKINAMNLMSMAGTMETITTCLLHRKRNTIFANRSVAAGERQTNKNQIRQESSFS